MVIFFINIVYIMRYSTHTNDKILFKRSLWLVSFVLYIVHYTKLYYSVV